MLQREVSQVVDQRISMRIVLLGVAAAVLCAAGQIASQDMCIHAALAYLVNVVRWQAS